jgi:predicted dehydrogenase
MELTPEARMIGRRNFLKAVSGTSALAALGTTAIVRGPIRGGPVRAALVGYGKQGRILRSSIDSDVLELVAICDIRPASKADTASEGARWYQDWRLMLQQENVEAVLIATPLCTHAEIATGCLEAGKHVFCETAMASDASGCRQMMQASQRSRRLLAVGYQDYYEPLYWAAYHNILKQGILGDIYTVEAAWHSYNSGRFANEPDAVSFDPRPWGYASLEQLVNWRLYRRCSNGLIGEWGGSLVSLTNWFLEAVPVGVQATGGIYSYNDGRDVDDHVYATLEYPNGRTATLSLIQSNGFEGSYTQFMGTKGTLIIGKDEALLFAEEGSRHSAVAMAKLNASQPVLDTSASRREEATNHSVLTSGSSVGQSDSMEAFRQELAGFCGAIRTGAPMRCDTLHAYDVALTCFTVNDAVEQKKRLNIKGVQGLQAFRQSGTFDATDPFDRRFQHA